MTSRRGSLLDNLQDIAQNQELQESETVYDEEDELDDSQQNSYSYAYDYDEDASDSRNESVNFDSIGPGIKPLDPLYEENENEHTSLHTRSQKEHTPSYEDMSSYGLESSVISSHISNDESMSKVIPGAKGKRSSDSMRLANPSREATNLTVQHLYTTDVRERRHSKGTKFSENKRARNRRQQLHTGTQPVPSDGSLGSSSGKGSVFRRHTWRQSKGSMKQHLFSPDNGTSMQLSLTAEYLKGGDEQNWENVAAAAAVVAASAQAPTRRGHVQFTQGDKVLCMLTLLNITNRDDDKTQFTNEPVNSFGYPPGAGAREAERQGPYNFVLCVVKNVHFDEDERYYTVIRMDTGSEQRADPGWMEPISDTLAIEAAFKAAKTTREDKKDDETNTFGACIFCKSLLSEALRLCAWPITFYRSRFIPFYRRSRKVAKTNVSHLMFGDPGFAWNFQITGINVLVACNFTFLFLQPISLGFLSAKYDGAIAVANFSVWIILVFELVFEVIICPSNYWQLMYSDKAYEPSTARNISIFHFLSESIALLLYIPDIPCAFGSSCGDDVVAGLLWSSLHSVVGQSTAVVFTARLLFGLTFLRGFGLIRHWKHMWLNKNFSEADQSKKDSRVTESVRKKLQSDGRFTETSSQSMVSEELTTDILKADVPLEGNDQDLKNAAFIGTALMLVNSQRALLLLIAILAFFPAVFTLWEGNSYHHNDARHLLAINRDFDDCEYLFFSIQAWLMSNAFPSSSLIDEHPDTNLLYVQVLPVRCEWQRSDGIVTDCSLGRMEDNQDIPVCHTWALLSNTSATPVAFAGALGVRIGGLTDISLFDGDFSVRTVYNDNDTVQFSNAASVILLFSMLVLAVVGLQVLRGDADRLVLRPLRRMLKIIIRYAENPLAQGAELSTSRKEHKTSEVWNDDYVDLADLGNYETEQLITAISKITDLLRKCWGIAGAGIISSNLARAKDGSTVVFNPTVSGKRVYALFGFVGIKEFDRHLRALESDVMILINDVARIIHDEVYRWSFGDSGQCNKNLGGAFLMVYRIGDFSEVHQKQKRATNVLFNSQMNRNVKLRKQTRIKGRQRRASSRLFDVGMDGILQLASLPGIQSFTDRAVLGMLKSFAGLHRDKAIKNWQRDFRLGAGVGAFTVDVLYGMDAGWAVEGAVGSEYKIDATYLSPHVNMASRMMSASKQYGVNILLSQAVEELMSKNARTKLRHLDTVYVKGSTVAQQIFTYDCRHEGVDFFLLERSPEQAEYDADHYSPSIWDTDADLRAMRNHISKIFLKKFRRGVDLYIQGNWVEAIDVLGDADNTMIRNVIEEGYIDIDLENVGDDLFNRSCVDEEIVRLRQTFGDGPCRCLQSYMERRHAIPPKEWHGVRKLMSK